MKQAVKSVVDLIKEPFYALRDAISKVIKTVKVVVKKIKRTLVAIKRLVLSIRESTLPSGTRIIYLRNFKKRTFQ